MCAMDRSWITYPYIILYNYIYIYIIIYSIYIPSSGWSTGQPGMQPSHVYQACFDQASLLVPLVEAEWVPGRWHRGQAGEWDEFWVRCGNIMEHPLKNHQISEGLLNKISTSPYLTPATKAYLCFVRLRSLKLGTQMRCQGL